MPQFIECECCEGSGREQIASPTFFDPYGTRDGGECRFCDRVGEIEVEDEPVEIEDFDEAVESLGA